MSVFICLSLLPLLVSCFFKDVNFDKKQKKSFLIITGIALILFLGLRNKYLGSTDTYNYYSFFEYALTRHNWSSFYPHSDFEIGFQMFVWLLSRVTSNAQILLLVTAFIYIASLMRYIYHNSDDVVLSVVMYITLGLMFFEMQGMRQSVAISICLISYEFLKKNKLVLFVLCVIFACTFHKTAIVFLVLWLFRKYTLTPKHLLIFTLLGGGVLVFCNTIIEYANSIFDMNYGTAVEGGGLVATSIYILTIIFVYVFVPRDKIDKEFSLAFYMMLLGFVAYIVRYIGALASERISFYFMFAQLTVLPNAICSVNDEKEKPVIKTVVAALSVLLMIYRLSDSEFVPFLFYWQS